MTRQQATLIISRYNIPTGQDFHALDTDTVARIIAAADAWGYRAPRNANGSRARYFHAFLCRVMAGPAFRIEYVIQQNFGKWEDVNYETTPKDARRSLREYRENMPKYPVRLIRRRVPT